MDVLFRLPRERGDSGGRKRREEQAADKERKDIQRWMSFFICQRGESSGGFGVGKEEGERDAGPGAGGGRRENKLERTAGTAEGFVRRSLHGKPAGCFFARAVRVF